MPRFLIALGVLSLLAGCGSSDQSGSTADGKESVVVGFYPLQYAAEQIGGDRVSVRNLTGSGVEPHDLELTPRDVGDVDDADLVVSISGFQPALDDAVKEADAPNLDAATVTHADRTVAADGSTGRDPHVWLDPLRMADLGDAMATRLGELDPDGRGAYQARAATFRQQLQQLDGEFSAGLKDCRSRALVTSHAAFGYLADRYDLRQVSVSGLRPDSEPTPAELATLVTFIRDNKVTTVYSEVLVSNAIERTVASETGATVARLDPIEGLAADSAAGDYPGLMRADLAALRSGLGCR